MRAMQIIAQRGEEFFLVLTSGSPEDLDGAVGRIFDASRETISPEAPAASIIARGYWQDVPASVDTDELLDRVRAAS